ncbi:MAG: ABC transporter permease [Nanoarchaeota archaeon]
MNIIESLKIAVNNLLHRKIRSWLTLIGIFAGIAAIVALISLGQGLEGAVAEQFAMLGVDSFTVQGTGTGFGPPGTDTAGVVGEDDIRLIESIQGVNLVMGRFIQATQIESGGVTEQGFAFSMPEGQAFEYAIRQYNLETREGRIVDNKDHNLVTLGASVTFDGRTPKVGEKVTVQDKNYRIAGILKKTGNPIIDRDILMSTNEMIDVFNLSTDSYNLLTVVVHDENHIPQLAELTQRKMRQDRNLDKGEEDFSISTPQDTLESFQNILMTVQILLVGIAAISLLVGSINIANTMYTSVLERRRDIGIMKAIGARNSDILNIFLIESGLLGVVGGAIGLGMGVGIGKLVEVIASSQLGTGILQASVSPTLIIGSLTFAFVIGALSGTLPARQASQMNPVEALRK